MFASHDGSAPPKSQLYFRFKNLHNEFISDVDPGQLSERLIQKEVIPRERWDRIVTLNPKRETRSRELLCHLLTTWFPGACDIVAKLLQEDKHPFYDKLVSFPILVNFIAENIDVWGLTKLRNKIYVLPQRPRQILVFEDRNEFRRQKKIKINQIKTPYDIGSNEKENCLYVSDPDGNCVWKIKPEETEEDQRIVKWLNTAEDEPRCLSVSSDGQLLLVSWSSSTKKLSLKIYGPEADLRFSVEFKEEILELTHAVKTSTGNFFILHGWKKEDRQGSDGSGKREEKWNLSELSGDGKTIIRRFIPKNEEQKLIDPKYLSIDSDDRVFLADFGKEDEDDGRVILLDSDLNWNRTLLPTKEEKEGKGKRIRLPFRLFYDEKKNQLIVGGDDGVNVYSLTRNQF